jgi:uncharacterized protein YndB with AHSA1/START domain
MRTFTATTTMDAPPVAVLDVLTDPGACARWAPVDFRLDGCDGDRLAAGDRRRVRGRLAGVEVAFTVEVLEADEERLALRASGPLGMDVAYDVAPCAGGSRVFTAIAVRPERGLRALVLAESACAVLRAGALPAALDRIGREAAALSLT